MQEASPACLMATRGYITFMEYLVALEEDAKENAHSMSIAHVHAQRVADLIVIVEVEVVFGLVGN